MANETVKKSRIYQDLDLSFTATDSNDAGKKLVLLQILIQMHTMYL